MSIYTLGSYKEGAYLVRNYTKDQAGKDIWDEDVLQAANGMYYMTEEIEAWKVKNMLEMPTYGNCYKCYWGGPINEACLECDPTVERISLSSLRQSLRITVASLTDPHVILHLLWCA